MARGRAPSLSVPQLLNEVQRCAAAGHVRYAKALWDLHAEEPDATVRQLQHAVRVFMTAAEKNAFQDRILRFLAIAAGRAASPPQVAAVEALLADVAALSRAKDAAARWRACQLVQALLGGLPPDAELADEAAAAAQAAMLERLEDPRPAVRAAAARALARLPCPDAGGDFGGCAVTAALLELLAADKSREARRAALAALPAAPATTPAILARTLDEADDVRRAAYLALADKVPLGALAAADRAALVRRGLGDRAPAVAEAAGRMVAAWLDGPAAAGEPLALLRALGAEAHPAEAEAVVRALAATGRLNPVQAARLAGDEGLGLRADFGAPGAALLPPEAALMWRVLAECLSGEAAARGLAAAGAAGAVASIEAAAAGERLEALEAMLPPSVGEFVAVVARHAAGGPRHRFATGQLMLAAARCADFADAAGRAAAAEMLRGLLLSGAAAGGDDDGDEARAEGWHAALALLLRRVHSEPAELAAAMLGTLAELAAGLPAAADEEGAWRHALATAALMLEALPSARPAAAAAAAGGWGLADVLHELVQPGLRAASPRVRAEAVRCLGLYCMLEGVPTSLPSHLAVLRAALAAPGEAPAVRARAAQALGDLALQRGARALDALAPPAEAGADDAAAAAAGPVVDALLAALAAWQVRFSEAEGEGGAAGEAAAAAEGLALAEALARLVLTDEFRAAAAPDAALEEGDVLRALVALLLLSFDAGARRATRMRQALAVFFGRYATLSLLGQQYLATALLPAARTAVAADLAAGARAASAASAAAPRLLRYVGALLSAPVAGVDAGAHGHEQLAELVLGEVLACAARPGRVPPAYLAALCRLPLTLPACPPSAGGDARATARRVRALALRARDEVSARGPRRDLEAVAERFACAGGGADDAPLGDEDVAALLDGVRAHLDAFCEGYPAAHLEGDAAAPRGRARRAAAASSDDDDGDSDGGSTAPAPAPRRRLPSRATRAAAAVVDASSSDEEARARGRLQPKAAPPPPAAAAAEGSSSDEDDSDDGGDWAENAPAPAAGKGRRRSSMSAAEVDSLRKALRENTIRDA